MDGDKDEMSQFRDGVAFEERCSEVEALLKDIGKAVMEDAAPGKLAKLSQELGFGPESSDDDDEDEEAGQGKADNKTCGQWSGALKTLGLSSYTRRSSFGASLNFGASLMGVMGKKKGMTMKQAAVVIQQWIRGILVRSWLARSRAKMLKEAEEVRERQLKQLGDTAPRYALERGLLQAA